MPTSVVSTPRQPACLLGLRADTPALPTDFDFMFHNSATPDLVWRGGSPKGQPTYLQGNEPFGLLGVLAEGRLDGTLPGITLHCEIVDFAGQHRSLKPVLDTVVFDTDARTVSLVWRVTLRREWNIAVAGLHCGAALQHTFAAENASSEVAND